MKGLPTDPGVTSRTPLSSLRASKTAILDPPGSYTTKRMKNFTTRLGVASRTPLSSLRASKTCAILDPRISSMTEHCGQMSRREKQVVSPDVLKQFHKMHGKYKCEHRHVMSSSLHGVWGKDGSWVVYADVPKSSEQPYNERSLILRPKGAGSAQSILARWGVAAVNTKGCKGEGDTGCGQDNLCIARLANGFELFCVLDGHGTTGEWPAKRAASTLPFVLQGDDCSLMLKSGRADAAFAFAFDKVEKDLESTAERQRIDLRLCGTTAVCALQDPDRKRLWVACVGDSRAVLLDPKHGVVYETEEHKPSNEAEAKRVKENGCEIDVEEHDDGYIETRVCLEGLPYPALSMTRSLGDTIVKKNGVIADPEVVEWQLPSSDALLLACCDGVWDFLRTEDVASFVFSALDKGETHERVAHMLVERARELWKQSEDDYCDDITVILARVGGNAQAAPPVECGPDPPDRCDDCSCYQAGCTIV